jgi:hypothetical protein
VICKNCGTENGKGVINCVWCGSNLRKQVMREHEQEQRMRDALAVKQKEADEADRQASAAHRKAGKVLIAAVCVFAAALALFFYYAYTVPQTADISRCYTIETQDGYMDGTYSLNVVRNEKDPVYSVPYNRAITPVNDLLDNIGYSYKIRSRETGKIIPNDEYFYNGEKITVYIKYDKKLFRDRNVTLKGTKKHYTVRP